MNQGVDTRARDGKQRHRFREPIDTRPPLLSQQKQNRRNESPGVADADPKHEIGDIKRPTDRLVLSPYADARGNEVCCREESPARDRQADQERRPPPARHRTFDDPANQFRQAVIAMIA